MERQTTHDTAENKGAILVDLNIIDTGVSSLLLQRMTPKLLLHYRLNGEHNKNF